jgi:dihydroflavonol-4-reductase
VRVLVIGATGFVGSHVARALVCAGHAVTGFMRRTSSRELVADLDLSFAVGDVANVGSLRAAVRGHDAVVFCAGALSLTDRHAPELHATNVIGARNVVAACLAEDVGRLVYDGTAGIYAGSSHKTPADERGHPSADRYTSYHVTAMALAESEVLRGVARGLDAVLLHPTLVVGEGDRSLHSSWLLLGAARARIGVCPPGGVNLVAVEDVARAHVLALERAPRGAIYLLGGEDFENRALFELLGEIVGNDAPIVGVGAPVFHALGALAGAVGRGRGAIDLSLPLARAATLYWFVDASRARSELGWQPSPVRPALERQLAWLRSRDATGPRNAQLLPAHEAQA